MHSPLQSACARHSRLPHSLSLAASWKERSASVQPVARTTPNLQPYSPVRTRRFIAPNQMAAIGLKRLQVRRTFFLLASQLSPGMSRRVWPRWRPDVRIYSWLTKRRPVLSCVHCLFTRGAYGRTMRQTRAVAHAPADLLAL